MSNLHTFENMTGTDTVYCYAVIADGTLLKVFDEHLEALSYGEHCDGEEIQIVFLSCLVTDTETLWTVCGPKVKPKS